MIRRLALAAAAAALAAGTAVVPQFAGRAAAAPEPTQPALTGRATIGSDYLAEGPRSGAEVSSDDTGVSGPFDGQPIPGFSAIVDNGDGTFWGMPDNGFGAKDNSADFLLRLYLIRPDFTTGETEIIRFITLSDPDRVLDFEITNPDGERALTGADFDIESVQRQGDGSFWIGEEFGPFLLHVDADGKVLQDPVPLPGVASPQNPLLDGEPNLPPSGGFEAMFARGGFLYPILEKATTGQDSRSRTIFEFDPTSGEYTDNTWTYRTDRADDFVADAYVGADGIPVILERDNFDGAAAVVKRLYALPGFASAAADDTLSKELRFDLLKIDNPDKIGAGDGWGTGDPFAFGFVSVEVAIELSNGQVLIANDNNFPFDDARRPGRPDDVELITIAAEPVTAQANPNKVIAHRGASGYRPEHTLAAYELAIQQCADAIEPDLVSTADGVLVDRHENEISGTTDVADRPEFADRKATKTIDGAEVTGWFTEDFTLAELRTLRAKERLPELRPGSAEFDGLYEVPTFDEVIEFAQNSRTCTGKPVEIVPEIKHGSYFDSIGLSQEEKVVEDLTEHGLADAADLVTIQSFEVGNLVELNGLVDVELAQLINCSGAPADQPERPYTELVTPEGLAEIAGYADQIGLCKDVMIPRDEAGRLLSPSPVIADAEAAGLETVGWTFRAENQFLPAQFRSSDNPAEAGDLAGEICAFVGAGLDVVFSDQPDLAVAAVGDCAPDGPSASPSGDPSASPSGDPSASPSDEPSTSPTSPASPTGAATTGPSEDPGAPAPGGGQPLADTGALLPVGVLAGAVVALGAGAALIGRRRG
ncbi:esterase-like activity of phytase family protein [Naumannella huperziae]